MSEHLLIASERSIGICVVFSSNLFFILGENKRENNNDMQRELAASPPGVSPLPPHSAAAC
jgi:hypothetical protein